MYCQKCGKQNDDNVYKCVQCGNVLQQVGNVGARPQHVPNYLAQSILVTLFCCLPLGIPAIVFSAQVNGQLLAGDIAGAMESSRKAQVFGWWAFGIGLAGSLIYFLLMIGGVLAV